MHSANFIKTFHFALITASLTLISHPIVGNHSGIGKYGFHAKYVAKKFSRNTFLVSERFFKVAANQRHIEWKRSRRLLMLFYLHIILFSMHERCS